MTCVANELHTVRGNLCVSCKHRPRFLTETVRRNETKRKFPVRAREITSSIPRNPRLSTRANNDMQTMFGDTGCGERIIEKKKTERRKLYYINSRGAKRCMRPGGRFGARLVAEVSLFDSSREKNKQKKKKEETKVSLSACEKGGK